MDKALLLSQLATAREKAEAANLEIVTHWQHLAQLGSKGHESTGAKVKLNSLRMAEQKCIRELTWILDQLDSSERESCAGPCRSIWLFAHRRSSRSTCAALRTKRGEHGFKVRAGDGLGR
jgi:hypothetical protein